MRNVILAAIGLLMTCWAHQAGAEMLLTYDGETSSNVGKPVNVAEDLTATDLQGQNLSPGSYTRTSGGDWISVNSQSDTVRLAKAYPRYLSFKVTAATGTTFDATSLTLDAHSVFAGDAKDASFGVDSSADADGLFDHDQYIDGANQEGGSDYTNALLEPDSGGVNGVIHLGSTPQSFEFPLGSGHRNLNEVSFRLYPAIQNATYDLVLFDDITLNSEPIPEPRSLALVALGCVVLLLQWRGTASVRG